MPHDMIVEWVVRLFAAILAGIIIGIEREARGKAAGLRTIVLISLGSCLFMISSDIVGSKVGRFADSGRIAAQVVSGVGFLGAGAIIISRDRIMGLTTAAVVWVTAGIGLIIGLGYELFGLLVSVVTLMVLTLLNLLEVHILSRWFPKSYHNYDSEDEGQNMDPH